MCGRIVIDSDYLRFSSSRCLRQSRMISERLRASMNLLPHVHSAHLTEVDREFERRTRLLSEHEAYSVKTKEVL